MKGEGRKEENTFCLLINYNYLSHEVSLTYSSPHGKHLDRSKETVVLLALALACPLSPALDTVLRETLLNGGSSKDDH